MKTFKEFCKHYEYDESTKEAQKLYAEYEKQIEIFTGVIVNGKETRKRKVLTLK